MAVLNLFTRAVGYSDEGDGQPILLVHGSATSRRFWNPIAAELTARHRVLAVDLFGYGESAPWPAERMLTPADEGALIDAVAARAGGPVHLVGHSYGGALAAEYAARNPGRVASLVLIEPSAFNLLRAAEDAAIRAEIEDLALAHIALVLHGRLAEAAELFMTYWVGTEAWRAMPEARRRAIVAAMPKVAAEWRLICFRLGGIATYARLPRWTTLICGGATKRPSRRIVELVRAFLPDAGYAEIAGAAHMAPLTHPAAVTAAIAAHLAGAAAESRPRAA
ncbi:MAG: alpha/beta fold hydrolase [Alphaproteobacteria bacterium]|nr:alpha/beta fold hydrolase [Alphaproteobacteria bacterium]